MKTLIAFILLIATCSCSTQKNLTNLVKALAKDPATVRISYGPLIFERFVPQTNQPGGYVPMPVQWGQQAPVILLWPTNIVK